jgi:hypothetical protein
MPADDNPSGKKLPSRKKLLSLVDEAHTTKKKMQSASGSLGDSIRNAVDKDNLHAPVFKLVAKLDRMDERARDEFLDTFSAYCDIMDEERWGALRHHGDLADAAERAADGEANGGANPAKGRRRSKDVDGMPGAKDGEGEDHPVH